MRKETKVKRARERGANSNLSSSYLEPEREDGSDDENAISLSAIKNKFNKKSISKSNVICYELYYFKIMLIHFFTKPNFKLINNKIIIITKLVIMKNLKNT